MPLFAITAWGEHLNFLVARVALACYRITIALLFDSFCSVPTFSTRKDLMNETERITVTTIATRSDIGAA